MIGKIKGVLGHIGPSFVDAQGVLHKGTVLLDVIEQVESLPKDVTEIEIPVNSPGGFVDIGDSIYDYIVSLKKNGKVKIRTIQTGLIGSISTKIFSAGDEKLADDRYKFWIHNPYQENVTGDSDVLQAAADATAETEKKLRKFYSEITGITDEGLDGLMKIETGLTADQCVKFKFATGKVQVPVFNAIDTTAKKMATKKPEQKDEKSFYELMKAFFAPEDTKKKGVQPKAAIPTGADPKSLVVNLADGAGSFYVEGEALVEGAMCFLLDADGNPTKEAVQDGPYVTAEGAKVNIKDGKIETLEMPVDPDEEEEEEAVATKIAEAVAAAKAEMKKEFDALTLALKKETKLGIQPKPAVLGLKKDGQEEYKTISQIQTEREANRRKSQFNTK